MCKIKKSKKQAREGRLCKTIFQIKFYIISSIFFTRRRIINCTLLTNCTICTIMEVKEVFDMFAMSSSDVRREWSSVLDCAVRKRPVFIKRTRDRVMLCSTEMLEQLIGGVTLVANQFVEADGSVTLSLAELDITAHGGSLQSAKSELVNNLLEYAEEYYREFELYSRAPNRKNHLPFVMKALIAKSPAELEDSIVCRVGEI